ncbi:hypothetical protein, partial [Metallibacterium scheffleri]|uniref:hypothetical protein n=1 Tax=Metallibacterium scheffleri TaxID=993689 RepID=UPI0023F5497E
LTKALEDYLITGGNGYYNIPTTNLPPATVAQILDPFEVVQGTSIYSFNQSINGTNTSIWLSSPFSKNYSSISIGQTPNLEFQMNGNYHIEIIFYNANTYPIVPDAYLNLSASNYTSVNLYSYDKYIASGDIIKIVLTKYTPQKINVFMNVEWAGQYSFVWQKNIAARSAGSWRYTSG